MTGFEPEILMSVALNHSVVQLLLVRNNKILVKLLFIGILLCNILGFFIGIFNSKNYLFLYFSNSI